ncbi:MAG: LysM peptidoglycan-binding domain-containing protein [Bacteroidota bacterium]|jgi:LysM repeat protein/ABC-type branched-subunit amino acid transport system substrate-binding protein
MFQNINNKTYLVYLFLFTILFNSNSFSQDNSPKSETRTIGNRKYIVHRVEKGQSLYSISKKYNLDINTILDENPKAKDGISQGQELLIPVDISTSNLELDVDTSGYVIHKVLKGETMYGLIKKYSVTESDLKILNPFIKNGLKEGQRLRIKKRNVNPIFEADKNKLDGDSDSSFIWYTAVEKDSLVHVAKKFKTSASKIQRLNKWSYREFLRNKTLKPGQKIKIFPNRFNDESKNLLNQNEEKIGNSIRITDTLVSGLRSKKKLYKVGIFLPLGTSESEFPSIENLIQNKKNFPTSATLIADFYMGYKLALDSISSSDFKVQTIVFDANENDSARLIQLVKSESFSSLDLIYGPWFSSVFPIVSEAAHEKGIPCVSPTLQQNKILFKNNTTFKMLPSKNYLLEFMAESIADNYYKKTGVNVINSDKPKDQNAISYFKEYYNEYLNYKYGVDDTIAETKGSNTATKSGAVAVLLTDNVPFITSYFTQLGRSVNNSKSFALYGFYNWMNLDNLDQGYYGRYNFHCVNPYFINKQDERVINLWEKYRKTMYSDPDEIYFQAFDLSVYFLGMMKKFGPDFHTQLADFPFEGVVMSFNFFSPDMETGFENRSAKLVEVKENRLYQVKKEKNVRKKSGNK